MCRAIGLGCIWSMRTQGRMLQVRDSPEIRPQGRPMRHLPAALGICICDTFYGRLYKGAVRQGIQRAPGMAAHLFIDAYRAQKLLKIFIGSIRSSETASSEINAYLSLPKSTYLQANPGKPRPYHLKAVEAFFDDKGHFEEMRCYLRTSACSWIKGSGTHEFSNCNDTIPSSLLCKC